MSMWDAGDKDTNGKFGKDGIVVGVVWEVVEWVKYGTLRWYECMMIMNKGAFVKRI